LTGIADLFREFSEPDAFDSQYQLELFGWQRRKRLREWRKENRQRVTEYKQGWRDRRRSHVRQYQRAYMAHRYANDPAFRERLKAYQRAYQAKRREERAA
jgi:hypothetical protein